VKTAYVSKLEEALAAYLNGEPPGPDQGSLPVNRAACVYLDAAFRAVTNWHTGRGIERPLIKAGHVSATRPAERKISRPALSLFVRTTSCITDASMEILRDRVFIYDLFRRIARNASRNSFSACRFLADRQFPRYRAPCSSRVPIEHVAASIYR
jgi:hypothetical protein